MSSTRPHPLSAGRLRWLVPVVLLVFAQAPVAAAPPDIWLPSGVSSLAGHTNIRPGEAAALAACRLTVTLSLARRLRAATTFPANGRDRAILDGEIKRLRAGTAPDSAWGELLRA